MPRAVHLPNDVESLQRLVLQQQAQLLSRDVLIEQLKLQLARLKEALHYGYERVPHYRQKFDAAGVHPEDFKDFSDLPRFPFTSKDDLRQNYPFGMFAVPMDEVVRIHASSGTTGKPTVVGYTRGDIDLWSGLMARSIRACESNSNSTSPAGVRSTDFAERSSNFAW